MPWRYAHAGLAEGVVTESTRRRVLPGMTNHLIGNDPREWRTRVRSYAEVVFAPIDH